METEENRDIILTDCFSPIRNDTSTWLSAGSRQKVNTTFSVVFTVRNWKLCAMEWNGMKYCWRCGCFFLI